MIRPSIRSDLSPYTAFDTRRVVPLVDDNYDVIGLYRTCS